MAPHHDNEASIISHGVRRDIMHDSVPFPTPQPTNPRLEYATADSPPTLSHAAHRADPPPTPGSGHHYAGTCVLDGCLLLDLGALDSVTVDPVTRTATVGPAAKASSLQAACAEHGLHFPGPHLPSVGVSGFILGGSGDELGVSGAPGGAGELVQVGPQALFGRRGGGALLVPLSHWSHCCTGVQQLLW